MDYMLYLIDETKENIKQIFDLRRMPLFGKIRYIAYLVGLMFYILVLLTRGFGTESNTILIVYIVIGTLLICQADY
jgi:hypothetical protein